MRVHAVETTSKPLGGVEPPLNAKLLFVVTEDWFFCSHFLPMARTAVGMGLDVAVVTRVRGHREAIEATGARVIAWNARRGSRGLLAAAGAVRSLAAILRAERPDLVHLIALKPVLLGGMAARMTGIERRIYAVTGLGFLGSRQGIASNAARVGLAASFRALLDGPRAHWLFENEDDPRLLVPTLAGGPRVTIVGGAGVDLRALACGPMPAPTPLRVAVVARMLWQKGIDLAVEAVQIARAQGTEVELSLFGSPDEENPKSIPLARLQEWDALPGVRWFGHTRDVSAVWASHHVCCLPSRGGEGLPRSILEGAACCRPVVTTDVAGCRSFVRNGVDGLVVKPEDPGHLAEAFLALAPDSARLTAMGLAARERVGERYTEEAVAAAVAGVYRDLLAAR